MTAEKKITIQAKNALKNNWVGAVGAILFALSLSFVIVYTVSLVFICIDSVLVELSQSSNTVENTRKIFLILSQYLIPILNCTAFVFASPFFLGVLNYFYLLAKNKDVEFREVFKYIGKKYPKALHISVAMILRCFFRVLLPLAPGIVGLIISPELFANADNESIAFFGKIWYSVSYAMLFMGILLATKLTSRYFLCAFLFFEDENASIEDIITNAQIYVMPLQNSVFILSLKLSPWILLCFTVIPIVIVLPYILTCFAISAKWIIDLKLNLREV